MHERQYLVDELTKNDTWRMFNIMAEFVEGFDVLPEVYPAVTIFGSARAHRNSVNYKTTEKVARLLVENNAVRARSKIVKTRVENAPIDPAHGIDGGKGHRAR